MAKTKRKNLAAVFGFDPRPSPIFEKEAATGSFTEITRRYEQPQVAVQTTDQRKKMG
jgi:hypothetical protein